MRLEGIAIAPESQQRGLGAASLTLAMHEADAAGVVAVTRNPATVQLVARCTELSSPMSRTSEPMANADHPEIREIVDAYAKDIGCAADALPIIQQRYPDGLYGADPGVGINIPELAANPNAGVIVAGIGRGEGSL